MQENILKFIENTGKTDGQICSLLGWNRNKITDIRRGKSKFTIEDIKKISESFQTSTDFILTGKQSETTYNNNVNNNKHSTITIQNGSTHTRELTELESELMKITSEFPTKEKIKLVDYAYQLTDKKGE